MTTYYSDLDFRHELLYLIKDGKDETILLKSGEQFIEELAYKFRTQLINEGLLPASTSLTRTPEGSAEDTRYKDIKHEISENALSYSSGLRTSHVLSIYLILT
jgi:hypothetical protein